MQVDTALALKRDAASSYSSSQVDTALALKRDVASSYSSSQVDTALTLKADVANVYDKTTVDQTISNIVDHAPTVLDALRCRCDRRCHVEPQAPLFIDNYI